MEKEVIKLGSSLAVIIPHSIASSIGIKKGDSLAIQATKNSIQLSPVQKVKPVHLKGIVSSLGYTLKDSKNIKKSISKALSKKWKNF